MILQTWLWQQKGRASVAVGGETIELNSGDVFIIPAGKEFSITVSSSYCI